MALKSSGSQSKLQFPFRLGTTSYILPDAILPNVTFLASQVDDIELLFFESDEISPLPDRSIFDQLLELKEQADLSYTVHLPFDIWLGSSSEETRRSSVEKCLRVANLAKHLDPFAYVIHFQKEPTEEWENSQLSSFRQNLTRSADELIAGGIAAKKLCVETLDYPFEYVSNTVLEADLSVCLDIGHLLYHGYSVEEHLEQFLDRCRVLHVHGVRDGKDHRDLSAIDAELLASLIERLSRESSTERVLTMEVFDLEKYDKSIDLMRKMKNE